MAGLNPQNAVELNVSVGNVLRSFNSAKDAVNRAQNSVVALNLQGEPYLMSAEDEGLIKDTLATLDAALDAIDMANINRLIGIY